MILSINFFKIWSGDFNYVIDLQWVDQNQSLTDELLAKINFTFVSFIYIF